MFVWFRLVQNKIYNSNYGVKGNSKANRMRCFFEKASKQQLIACLNGLLQNWRFHSSGPISPQAKSDIKNILARLSAQAPSSKPKQPTRPQPLSRLQISTLLKELMDLSSLAPQARGFAYEKFLKNFFNAYNLSARASFRLIGEQIDGSLQLGSHTYLLEAKWQNAPADIGDLHKFEGKLGQKAAWTRGLFISNSGFSPDSLESFGKDKRTICLDGHDIAQTLQKGLSFPALIDAKARRAAETGSPYTPLENLLTDSVLKSALAAHL